ncbi:MAG: IclR family transcriptional regulator [Candidatus Acidiferrales bacterium]
MIRARQSKAAPVGVVGKVLRILEALDSSPTGLQLRQIAQQTSIHKSTAYRFLAHLEGAGYLFRDDSGAYVIGPRLAHLGAGISFHATLRKVSRPALQKVWRTTKETVNLAVIDGHEILYLDVIESGHMFRMGSQVGMRRALYCTGLGKALLAFLPLEQREEMFASLSFERVTNHTIPDAARLRKELAKIFRQGFALDDQEAVLGARCVAAPILDDSGKIVAALSVSGPITRISRDKIPSFAASVKSAAKDISSRLNRST